MMGALREWLTSIVVTAMLLALVQSLIPEGTIRRIGSFTGGLILMITLMQPLLGCDLQRLELNFAPYQEEIRLRGEELEQNRVSELSAIIEQQTAAYILDKAEALGAGVEVQVQTETGENGMPVPVAARLQGPYSAALAAYMERELGISTERQVWHEN